MLKKKLISALVLIVYVISLLPVVSFAEDVTYYFSDNFDSYVTNEKPTVGEIKGLNSRIYEHKEGSDKAMALKVKTLYAAREDFKLKKGDYFIVDLIGMPVIDNKNGKVYGEISDVINRGASDIYVVKTESGERMMPAVAEFVKKVDVERGVFVEVIPGLLSDD